MNLKNSLINFVVSIVAYFLIPFLLLNSIFSQWQSASLVIDIIKIILAFEATLFGGYLLFFYGRKYLKFCKNKNKKKYCFLGTSILNFVKRIKLKVKP